MANFKLTQTGEQIQADLNLLDNNSATSGQVLQADGNGGASWQTPSGGGGGGTQMYQHLIYIEFPSTAEEKPFCLISFCSTRSEAFALSSFCSYLRTFGNYGLYVNGFLNLTEEVSDYPGFAVAVNAYVPDAEDYIYLMYIYVASNPNTGVSSGYAGFVFSPDSVFNDTVTPL